MENDEPEGISFLSFHSNEKERLSKAGKSVKWMRNAAENKSGFLGMKSFNPFLVGMLGFALLISVSWWVLDEFIPEGAELDGRRFEATAFFFDETAYVTIDSRTDLDSPASGEYGLFLAFDSGVGVSFRILATEKKQSFYYTVKTPEPDKLTVSVQKEDSVIAFSIPVERSR